MSEAPAARWQTRLQRIAVLQTRFPFATEALGFLRAVTGFQQEVWGSVTANLRSRARPCLPSCCNWTKLNSSLTWGTN